MKHKGSLQGTKANSMTQRIQIYSRKMEHQNKIMLADRENLKTGPREEILC